MMPDFRWEEVMQGDRSSEGGAPVRRPKSFVTPWFFGHLEQIDSRTCSQGALNGPLSRSSRRLGGRFGNDVTVQHFSDCGLCQHAACQSPITVSYGAIKRLDHHRGHLHRRQEIEHSDDTVGNGYVDG
jgi:hypothetical protein